MREKFYKSQKEVLDVKKYMFPFYQIQYDALIVEKPFNTAHTIQASCRSFDNFVLRKKDRLSVEQRHLVRKNPTYIDPSIAFCFENMMSNF